jgi:hypothetical protein
MKKAEDPTLSACKAFVQSVRTKQHPFANVDVGFGSAVACSIGKHAVRQGQKMKIPQLRALSQS